MKITLSLLLVFLAGYVFHAYFPQLGNAVGLR